MNTQLRIAFVLAFSVIAGAALAEDGISPRQEANGVEAPQVEAHEVPPPEAPRQEANGVEPHQVEAHEVPPPEAPRQEANGVEAPQVDTFTVRLSPLVGSRR